MSKLALELLEAEDTPQPSVPPPPIPPEEEFDPFSGDDGEDDGEDDDDDGDGDGCCGEQDVAEMLADALQDATLQDGTPVRSVSTFREAGVMSGNEGLVIRIGRCEFQVTVVQSR